jgi:hypothetical protein
VLGAPAVGDDGLIYLGTELRSPAGNGAVLYVLRP